MTDRQKEEWICDILEGKTLKKVLYTKNREKLCGINSIEMVPQEVPGISGLYYITEAKLYTLEEAICYGSNMNVFPTPIFLKYKTNPIEWAQKNLSYNFYFPIRKK